MLFNSIGFLIFLPIVFILYWFVSGRDYKKQNFLLLVASYFFYACWDWRFLFLLLFSTLLDYLSGLKINSAGSEKVRKIWFWLSIIINLSFLGLFKYFNFFADSFVELMGLIGISVTPLFINFILPVGISFYTFHGLSYIIDVYKRKVAAERNVIDYAVFVCFFPLLVAGPIERATHLLPQLKSKRLFDYDKAVDGLKQILWGVFKKVVIADNCAMYVNDIFTNYETYSGSTLLIGAIFFSVQIYGDFSGYTDIAIGVAKLFGINLLKNFAFPYFSRSIAEFWRRWHISLSSWFKDYVYIPLGGSKGALKISIRNVFIIFLLSGLWHGANWTFLVWGGVNAIFFIPSLVMKKNRNYIDIVGKNSRVTLYDWAKMISTFSIVTLAWIFFRSESLSAAFGYLYRLFSTLLVPPSFSDSLQALVTGGLIIVFFIIEWIGRFNNHALERFGVEKPRYLRYSFYYMLILLIFVWGGVQQEFIYFQF